MSSKSKKKKKMTKKKLILIILFVLLIVGLGLFLLLGGKDNKGVKSAIDKIVDKVEKKEEKKLKIVDLESDSRPYSVMINNHPTARKYHSGLQDAYMVYEIIVEGGYTRMLAVYKDAEVEKIGSVRSARHYFLDYALENDAVYVHWGWSPKAQSDIRSLGVANINGLAYEGIYFYRDKSLNVSLEHKGFTDTELINKAIDKLGYRKTSEKDILLNYVIDEIDMSSLEGATVANSVIINYSNSVASSYVYDAENKVYKRYVNDVSHSDYVTKEQYTAKNIITYQVSNYTISGDTKGRQNINNIGSGTGYYISNGYAVPIKWEKSSRNSQTKYMYNDGTEINVNDGNTFIQIQPKGRTLNISE